MREIELTKLYLFAVCCAVTITLSRLHFYVLVYEPKWNIKSRSFRVHSIHTVLLTDVFHLHMKPFCVRSFIWVLVFAWSFFIPQQLNRMTTGYNCSPFCMWSPTLMNIETINRLVFKKAIGQFNCKQKREWEVGFKFNIVVIPLAGWFKTACFSENAILNWFRCLIKRKKSFRLVSFRRCVCVCVRATHNPHHEMKDLHRMNKSRNKKPLWKIFRNHWAVRLPYTFVGGVETQNLYFYTNVCTVSEFESVSHFSSISHSLCFSLWLLFYEDVWVFAGRHRVLSKYLFIPCFVALQKYDYKNATKQMCMT